MDLLFRPAVTVIVNELRHRLTAAGTPIHVGADWPTEPLPVEFLRIRRTGGTVVARVVDAAQITLEAYAADAERSELVAMTGRRHVLAMKGQRTASGVQIGRVFEVSGPAELPDPHHQDLFRMSQTLIVQVRAVGASTSS